MDLFAYNPQPLQLGKGAAFVKSRLIRLPQEEDIWEADFRSFLVDPVDSRSIGWMGLIVHRDGWIVAEVQMETSPGINDMATLLANAMRRPSDGHPCRPRTIRLRKRREWEALHPHLAQLGIHVVAAPRLARWDEAFNRCCREAAKFQPNTPEAKLDAEFPHVASFVQGRGWIEIGNQEGFGFIVRALDDGGVVFESPKPTTLGEAMEALEEGLENHLLEKG